MQSVRAMLFDPCPLYEQIQHITAYPAKGDYHGER
jgi:hypothetical protein